MPERSPQHHCADADPRRFRCASSKPLARSQSRAGCAAPGSFAAIDASSSTRASRGSRYTR
jgi:hypothetical protein